MHERIIREIELFADDARSTGNPRRFLERLAGPSGLHVRWHFRGLRTQHGFLLFHWHLVEKVKELGLGVTALREEDFSPGGIYHARRSDWNTEMRPYMRPVRSLEELTNFSMHIECWNNDMHSVLEQVTGKPLSDPSQDVLYEECWRFYIFIIRKFEWQLQNYANATSIQGASFSQIVQQIEVKITASYQEFNSRLTYLYMSLSVSALRFTLYL